MKHALKLMPHTLAIARLDAGHGLPWWSARSDGLLAFVRTAQETSVVCEAQMVPDGVRTAGGAYRALRLAGTMTFEDVGVVSAIANPLAAAGVPIFVMSTFDTDYILVREARLNDAITALRAADHEVDERP
jgi:hypothetical protein